MLKALFIVLCVDIVFICLLVILMPYPFRPRLIHSHTAIFWTLVITNAIVCYVVLRKEQTIAAVASFVCFFLIMVVSAVFFGVLSQFDEDYRDTRYFEKYDRKYELTVYTNCDYFYITDITSSHSIDCILFERYTKHNDTIYLANNYAKLIKHTILIGFPDKKDTSILTHSSLNDFMDVKDSIVSTH